jgi:5'-nucleotidase
MRLKLISTAVAISLSLAFVGCNDTEKSEKTTIEKTVSETLTITYLAEYETKKEGGSEILAYDKTSGKIFVTNGDANQIDILSLDKTTKKLSKVSSIDLSSYGTGVNSVAVKANHVAVAVENGDKIVGKKQLKGKIVIFDTNGKYIKDITVGYLPDAVTFNEDGSKIVVSNEGEPNGKYSVDPIGSVGIITVATGKYTDINFSNATLTDAKDGTKVRLGKTPSNDQAKDLEPEYATVVNGYAYVTLQENNAIAKVDINNEKLVYVKSLGTKSYEVSSNNTIDIEEDGIISMKSFDALFALYQPDTIASYVIDGKTYLVTANEGDGREYEYKENGEKKTSFIDEAKIKKLKLDEKIAKTFEKDNDLKVMTDLGDIDGDGDYDKLYTYGGRSFSIWDENGDLVWDSKDEISKLVAKYEPELFNQDEGEKDKRSGNKGAEPEALTVGKVNGKTFAFVGLERQSSIVVYNITNPSSPKFTNYIKLDEKKHVSPEGMQFVPASESITGNALLLIASEMSGSTLIYEIK